MSAHLSVRRRHAKRFIYGTKDKRAENGKTGRKKYVDLLKGIPYFEERTRSGLQPGYWNETEEIDTGF